MPRKRKGPKREASEGDDPPPPHQPPPPLPVQSAVTGTSITSSPPLSMVRNSSADSTHARITNNGNKRARWLAEAEEDRLGKQVGLERWIECVGHGRGAAVCLGGHLVQTEDRSDGFMIELSCIQPNDPSQHTSFVATFQGELARKVSEPLLLLHRLGPPAIVYLSGFAAEVCPASAPASSPRAVFNQEKTVLKMSPQPPSTDPTAPTSAIWIEQLATLPAFVAPTATTHLARTVSTPATHHTLSSSSIVPSRSTALPQPHPEPSPPSQLSDWFSTPAPTDLRAAQPNAPAITSSSSTTRPQIPPPPLQPIDWSVAQHTATSIIKSEPHGASSSSSTPSPRSGRPASRQASAAATAPPPPQPRRNAPNVKPRRMGNCLYTPMSMLRDGERASIIGVVMAAGDPRRSSSGTRDLSIKVTIADASCLSGTGYAKELARSITVMLFAQQSERIPQNLAPGHIIAVRSVQIQMFSNKPQAVGKSAASWSWATYDPVSGDVRASSNFPLASHTPPECSADEMDHFRDMANWFSELQGVDANIVTRSSRPTLKLQEVGENTFFDTVVEVLKVYTHTLAPDLYVTDYTNHTLFYRGNDKYLRLESDIPYPDDTDGWGHVFQISLWDSHATIAEGLQTGDIIRIQNVRPKLNPRGLLTGGLGSSTDNGIKIRTLKPTDEARIDLEKRRARFMETLITAEEEAFADRAERDHQQASQQGREQQAEHASDTVQGATLAVQRNVSEFHNVDTVAGPASSHPIPAAIEATTNTIGFRGSSAQARTIVEASPASSTQPPFPTPGQRRIRAAQLASPSKAGPGESTPLGTSSHVNSSRALGDLSLVETPDVKPSGLMGPPGAAVEERRPLIKCNAPASIPFTALADLPATSLCPGMFKVKARVISTNPAKVEQWGRAECKACKRLLPLDQRFCIKCGDEEGESLSYCFRFAFMLEELDAEFVARKQQERIQGGGSGGSVLETSVKKTAIPLLFHGRMAEVLLPCVDAKALYNGERSSIKTLKRFHTRLLHPNEYGNDPEQVLAVYSYPSQESGRTVRRFAALKELNCLTNPLDLL